ncbi:MAG: hypothetical protein KGK07_04050 [Chloroflexota bacterium]|nr:hypothetical protein [Chloroflexota bacterium]
MAVQRSVTLVAALAALAFALAACGGGKGDANAPAAGATPIASAAAARGADASALAALGQKFAASTFNAQYTLTSSGGSQPLNGTMTMYKQGGDKFRFDIAGRQGGQDVSLTLIETKDASVFCLQDAGELAPVLGVQAGKGVCFKNETAGGTTRLTDITNTFKNLSAGGAVVTGKSTRTIAGQAAQCFQYKNNAAAETDETCFSADGVLLYDRTRSSADSTTVEATQVQGAVRASDFNVPYAIKQLPDLGNATPAP